MQKYTIDELSELRAIATARSGSVSAFERFKAQGLLKDAADGWIDITQNGERVLEAGGYQYDPKVGWKLEQSIRAFPLLGEVAA